jgi:hypothetical protein
MFKESLIALTEIVEMGLAIDGDGCAVARTLAVTGEKPLAGTTLTGERSVLLTGKGLLLGAEHHLADGLLADVSQPMLRKDEMVAAIDIAVPFHHAHMTTQP